MSRWFNAHVQRVLLGPIGMADSSFAITDDMRAPPFAGRDDHFQQNGLCSADNQLGVGNGCLSDSELQHHQ